MSEAGVQRSLSCGADACALRSATQQGHPSPWKEGISPFPKKYRKQDHFSETNAGSQGGAVAETLVCYQVETYPGHSVPEGLCTCS